MNANLARTALLLASATALSSCMGLSGNIKGSFTCGAPEGGSCAPTSIIDDKALSMIAGDEGDTQLSPAGPYSAPKDAAQTIRAVASANPARTGEKVLRIVFPSYIDGIGRLHERSVVHAVVDRGDWQSAAAQDAVATSPAEVAAATGSGTLLAAVERAEVPLADADDAAMPDPAAVEAARARASVSTTPAAADPIGAIKEDVARRLSPAKPSEAVRSTNAGTNQLPKASLNLPSSKLNPTSSAPLVPARANGTIVPARATEAGKAAIGAMNANPLIRSAAATLESDTLAAAGSVPVPTLQAPSFPGVTVGDQ